MEDDNSMQRPSRTISRRRALRSAAGLVGTIGVASAPAGAEYIPAPGGGGSGDDGGSEVHDQLVLYDEAYDQGAWEYKLTLTTALNYYGSNEVDRHTGTDYTHYLALVMNVNALQREYGESEWEHVDPHDGGSHQWRYQLDRGSMAVEIDGPSGTSLFNLGDDKVTAFDPGRGAPNADWDDVKEHTVDVIVDEVSSRIPIVSDALDAAEIISGFSADGVYDPNPLQTDDREEFPINYQGMYNLPSEASAYFDFGVKTELPCQSFDVTVDANFEIVNDGDRHRELEPVSVEETYTNGPYDKYYEADIGAYCD